MTHDDTPQNVAPTFIQFPPIPLFSGDTFRDSEGQPHPVQAAVITLTSADGTIHEVPLEFRFGGWWVPAGTPTP